MAVCAVAYILGGAYATWTGRPFEGAVLVGFGVLFAKAARP